MKYLDQAKRDPRFRAYAVIAAGVAASLLLLLLIRVAMAPRAQRRPLPAPSKPKPPVLHGPVEEPTISLRIAGTQKVLWLKVDDYVAGVVAAEMEPTWPSEALKAQAVLARTFIMQKIESGERSWYGTVASTDIHEFQAYKPSRINSKVKEAVAATRGQVLTHGGRFAFAFFHSCSGGTTATAYEGLNFTGGPTPYLVPVQDGPCSNPKVENWSTSVSLSEVAGAAGLRSASKVSVGSWGPSGRALTIMVGGKEITAVQLRRALGPSRMKSTLLTQFELRGGRVIISGKGWGHGVGMSQWGAHDKALKGMSFREILETYYPGTVLEKVW